MGGGLGTGWRLLDNGTYIRIYDSRSTSGGSAGGLGGSGGLSVGSVNNNLNTIIGAAQGPGDYHGTISKSELEKEAGGAIFSSDTDETKNQVENTRYQGSYSPVVETEYDDETDSNYEDYSSKTTTTNSGATRYEAGSYFDQSQSENAGSDYNQNQGNSYGAGRNSGSGTNYVDGSYFEQGSSGSSSGSSGGSSSSSFSSSSSSSSSATSAGGRWVWSDATGKWEWS